MLFFVLAVLLSFSFVFSEKEPEEGDIRDIDGIQYVFHKKEWKTDAMIKKEREILTTEQNSLYIDALEDYSGYSDFQIEDETRRQAAAELAEREKQKTKELLEKLSKYGFSLYKPGRVYSSQKRDIEELQEISDNIDSFIDKDISFPIGITISELQRQANIINEIKSESDMLIIKEDVFVEGSQQTIDQLIKNFETTVEKKVKNDIKDGHEVNTKEKEFDTKEDKEEYIKAWDKYVRRELGKIGDNSNIVLPDSLSTKRMRELLVTSGKEQIYTKADIGTYNSYFADGSKEQIGIDSDKAERIITRNRKQLEKDKSRFNIEGELYTEEGGINSGTLSQIKLARARENLEKTGVDSNRVIVSGCEDDIDCKIKMYNDAASDKIDSINERITNKFQGGKDLYNAILNPDKKIISSLDYIMGVEHDYDLFELSSYICSGLILGYDPKFVSSKIFYGFEGLSQEEYLDKQQNALESKREDYFGFEGGNANKCYSNGCLDIRAVATKPVFYGEGEGEAYITYSFSYTKISNSAAGVVLALKYSEEDKEQSIFLVKKKGSSLSGIAKSAIFQFDKEKRFTGTDGEFELLLTGVSSSGKKTGQSVKLTITPNVGEDSGPLEYEEIDFGEIQEDATSGRGGSSTDFWEEEGGDASEFF